MTKVSNSQDSGNRERTPTDAELAAMVRRFASPENIEQQVRRLGSILAQVGGPEGRRIRSPQDLPVIKKWLRKVLPLYTEKIAQWIERGGHHK